MNPYSRFQLLLSALLFAGCAVAATLDSSPAGQSTNAPLPGWARLNDVFNLPLWQDYLLWDDTDTAVAARLGLPEESRTSSQSSFRAYPQPGTSVLGTRPYSISLYAESGSVTYVSMVFANKGDIEGLASGQGIGELDVSNAQRKKALKNFKRRIADDAGIIETRLTALLGKPKSDSFGQGSSQVRERVLRWDVKSHSILLAAPREEYVALRVVPTTVADSEGKGDRISDMSLMKILESRVLRRDNGDVIIEDIPMVHQGPKGYCVPATWERYLRYLGIPADMYVLAMAGDTAVGGGTQMHELADNIEKLVVQYKRRMKRVKKPAKINTIERYIDSGLPVMWTLWVNKSHYADIDSRTAQRAAVSDWKQWKTDLKPWQREARNIPLDDAAAHVCMIIGYNKNTGEIATSDSWGPRYKERWMTEEEVEAISMGELWIISW